MTTNITMDHEDVEVGASTPFFNSCMRSQKKMKAGKVRKNEVARRSTVQMELPRKRKDETMDDQQQPPPSKARGRKRAERRDPPPRTPTPTGRPNKRSYREEQSAKKRQEQYDPFSTDLNLTTFANVQQVSAATVPRAATIEKVDKATRKKHRDKIQKNLQFTNKDPCLPTDGRNTDYKEGFFRFHQNGELAHDSMAEKLEHESELLQLPFSIKLPEPYRRKGYNYLLRRPDKYCLSLTAYSGANVYKRCQCCFDLTEGLWHVLRTATGDSPVPRSVKKKNQLKYEHLPKVLKKAFDALLLLPYLIRNMKALEIDSEFWQRCLYEVGGCIFTKHDNKNVQYLFPIQTKNNSMPGFRSYKACTSLVMELVGIFRKRPRSVDPDAGYIGRLHVRRLVGRIPQYSDDVETTNDGYRKAIQLTVKHLQDNGYHYLSPEERVEFFGNGQQETERHLFQRMHYRYGAGYVYLNQNTYTVIVWSSVKLRYNISKTEFPPFSVVLACMRFIMGPVYPSRSLLEASYNKIKAALVPAGDFRNSTEPCFIIACHRNLYKTPPSPRNAVHHENDFTADLCTVKYVVKLAGEKSHGRVREPNPIAEVLTLKNRALLEQHIHENPSSWDQLKEDTNLYSPHPTIHTLKSIPEEAFSIAAIEGEGVEVEEYCSLKQYNLISDTRDRVSFYLKTDAIYRAVYGEDPAHMPFHGVPVLHTAETAVFKLPDTFPADELLRGFATKYGFLSKALLKRGFRRAGGNDNVFRLPTPFSLPSLLNEFDLGGPTDNMEEDFKACLLDGFRRVTGMSGVHVDIDYAMFLRSTTIDIQKCEVACKRLEANLEAAKTNKLRLVCGWLALKETGYMKRMFLCNSEGSSITGNGSIVQLQYGSILMFSPECLTSEGLMSILGCCPSVFVLMWCNVDDPALKPKQYAEFDPPLLADDAYAYFGENGPLAVSLSKESDAKLEEWKEQMEFVKSMQTTTTLRARYKRSCPSIVTVQGKSVSSGPPGSGFEKPNIHPQNCVFIRDELCPKLMHGSSFAITDTNARRIATYENIYKNTAEYKQRLQEPFDVNRENPFRDNKPNKPTPVRPKDPTALLPKDGDDSDDSIDETALLPKDGDDSDDSIDIYGEHKPKDPNVKKKELKENGLLVKAWLEYEPDSDIPLFDVPWHNKPSSSSCGSSSSSSGSATSSTSVSTSDQSTIASNN